MFVFVLTYMHIVVYSMRAVGADMLISRFAVLPTAGFFGWHAGMLATHFVTSCDYPIASRIRLNLTNPTKRNSGVHIECVHTQYRINIQINV